MQNNSFGMRLSELRKSKGMTQLELADKLNVTDKAVSKWERDLAYPEVENLIKISDLFGVSLDILLKGEKTVIDANCNKKTEAPVNPSTNSGFLRKIIGTVLLCFGVLTFLVILLWGDLLSALLFASPFLLCGGICLIFKKRIGLFCSWAIFLSICIYLGYATGISLGSGLILRTIVSITMEDRLAVSTIISWSIWLIYLALTIWTAFSYRKEEIPRKKLLIIIATSIAVFVFLIIFSFFWNRLFTERALETSFLRYLNRILSSLIGTLKCVSVTVLVTGLFNRITNRKELKHF